MRNWRLCKFCVLSNIYVPYAVCTTGGLWLASSCLFGFFFLHLTWNINLKTCWGNDVLILPLTMAWRYLQFWGSCLSFFSDSSNFRQCSNVHARRHKCSRWSLQNNPCNCYLISNFSIGLYISLRSYLLEQNLSLF